MSKPTRVVLFEIHGREPCVFSVQQLTSVQARARSRHKTNLNRDRWMMGRTRAYVLHQSLRSKRLDGKLLMSAVRGWCFPSRL
jgi:hypothetical protein